MLSRLDMRPGGAALIVEPHHPITPLGTRTLRVIRQTRPYLPSTPSFIKKYHDHDSEISGLLGECGLV